MTKKILKSVASLLLATAASLSFVQAASLQVSPILVDIETEKSSASVLTLRNSGNSIVNAQVRVFKWSQAEGADVFDETTDVVASPPILKLDPQASNVIRVVRVKQSAPVGEESYRLIVDELPSSEQRPGTISMLVRHSIPMFFATAKASEAKVTWTLQRKAGKLVVKAENAGDRRLRLANMTASNSQGTLDFGKGLNGYVLGHSTLNITSKTPSKLTGNATLKADTHKEPLNVPVSIK